MTQLEQLRQRIIETLPRIGKRGIVRTNPLTLCDVLRYLNSISFYTFSVASDGEFTQVDQEDGEVLYPATWDMEHDLLDKQSEETINFLHSFLPFSPMENTPQSSAHTPGPWKLEEKFDGSYIVPEKTTPQERQDYGEVVIACLLRPNKEANARLIAAAPDLLAACLLALEEGDDYIALEAIKKAVTKAQSKAN